MDTVLEKLRSIDLGNIPGEKLLVPLDRDFLDWQNARLDTTGNVGIVENNTILNTYLKVKNIGKLGPDTKIPLGILILCHNMYLPGNRAPRLHEVEDIGGADITTRFPFGVLLGKDNRRTVLAAHKKPLVQSNHS